MKDLFFYNNGAFFNTDYFTKPNDKQTKQNDETTTNRNGFISTKQITSTGTGTKNPGGNNFTNGWSIRTSLTIFDN